MQQPAAPCPTSASCRTDHPPRYGHSQCSAAPAVCVPLTTRSRQQHVLLQTEEQQENPVRAQTGQEESRSQVGRPEPAEMADTSHFSFVPVQVFPRGHLRYYPRIQRPVPELSGGASFRNHHLYDTTYGSRLHVKNQMSPLSTALKS